MAEIIEDRVKQTSTSTGVGDITVNGNVAGFRTFGSVMSVGDTFHGVIEAVDANGLPTGDWESGLYTYSAANTITRTTVRSSSATSNGVVDFPAGTKVVFIDLTAYQIKRFTTASNNGTAVSPTGQTASQYTAVTFQEEFSGSTYDTTKWNPNIYYETNDPVQNFSVSNGNMNIYPQLSSGSFKNRVFTTKGKFEQTYGFFECEAKMAVGAGVNCRFVLFADDEHEIAGFSALSGAPNGSWSSTDMHPTDFAMWWLTNFTVGGQMQRGRNFQTIPDLSAAFHKYGIRWDSSTVRFYFDGVQIGPTLSHTTMTVPMYICISLVYQSEETTAVAGSGTLSSTNRYTPQGITNSFQVNYVRAWQIA